MYYFLFQSLDVRAQKIFLLLRFFNWISCNKGLKAKISRFYVFFLFNPPAAGMFQKQKDCFVPDVTQAEKIKKICIHGASRMERKRGKYRKSPIFEGKLRGFISYLSEMKMVSMFYNSSLLQHFLQLVSTIFCSGNI